MSEKKGRGQDPLDEDRGVEDILGGLLGSNAAGLPQGGANEPAGGGGSSDLAGMLGGLMGGGGAPAGGAGGSGDLMGMLGGLMGGVPGGGAGGGDLMGMLGGLLGGGQGGNSSVSSNAPSILSALLPLVMGMLGGGRRSGGVDLDQRTSNELNGMFGAAQSGALDMDQVRSSGVVHDVAAQTGTSEDEVAGTLAQLMQMLGNQR
jgi:hypothetical protein